jgi:hypothetical protein
MRDAERGSVDLLVQVLSSHEELHSDFRRWIADLFNPQSMSEYAAKIQRRRRGKPPQVSNALIQAANYVLSNINADRKLEQLVSEAIENVYVSRKDIPKEKPVSRSRLFDFLKSRYPKLSPAFRGAKRAKRRSG